jgi:hypothetical protein
MIIWRGRGIVIALIAFGCLLFTELATETTFSDADYYQTHGWPKLAALWLAALIVYQMLPWFEVQRTRFGYIPGQPEVVPQSELFFVPARFWPQVLIALGVVLLFVKT